MGYFYSASGGRGRGPDSVGLRSLGKGWEKAGGIFKISIFSAIFSLSLSLSTYISPREGKNKKEQIFMYCKFHTAIFSQAKRIFII